MKTAKFLAVLLLLLLAASSARADVFVYPLAYQAQVYAQPYQEESRVQMVRQAQYPAQPCGCPSACQCPTCAQPVAMQQLPPPPPQPVIAREDRTVYFGFNKSQLNNETKEKLNSLAGRIMSTDNIVGTRIVGYADRIGSVPYNQALSRRRAENVQSYLIDHGLIKPIGIETRWVGKSQASAHCSKYMPRAQLLRCLQPDRKVEVDIDYRTQPGVPLTN